MDNLVEKCTECFNDDLISENLNDDTLLNENEQVKEPEVDETASTDIIEYHEIEEPCVALTIIGESRLTNTEVFVKKGLKYSIKAFFLLLFLLL